MWLRGLLRLPPSLTMSPMLSASPAAGVRRTSSASSAWSHSSTTLSDPAKLAVEEEFLLLPSFITSGTAPSKLR